MYQCTLQVPLVSWNTKSDMRPTHLPDRIPQSKNQDFQLQPGYILAIANVCLKEYDKKNQTGFLKSHY